MSLIFASMCNPVHKHKIPGAVGAGDLQQWERIDILDLWRSVCVWMMLLYHLLWDLSHFELLPASLPLHPVLRAYALMGAGGFILLSGLCAPLCRSWVRTGLALLAAAAAVRAVSSLAGQSVLFGALHLLGCCRLLYGLLRRQLSPLLCREGAPLLCLGLFAAAGWLCARTRVPVLWLYPLGLRAPDFSSADYFPLLPWGSCWGCPWGSCWTHTRTRRCSERNFTPR